MNMYRLSILKDEHVFLQHFDRGTCTPKMSYDNIFYLD